MEETVELVPTSKYPELRLKYEFFNPFQSQFEREYDHQSNAVVSARTGAGKTMIAVLAAHRALAEGGRFIFLAPMKSLVREKYDEWNDEKHPFSEYGVSIMTGDYKLTNARKKELMRTKTILMTSEMLDSRSRRMHIEGNKWLMETSVLVVDESHIIGMWQDGEEPLQARGHKLEAALMRFSKLNPNCRIILLSATLPNLPQLGEWLTKLNNKQTKVIVSGYQPQPVNWHLDTYYEALGYGSYYQNKANMVNKAIEVVQQNKDDMWLIFCHSKTDGRMVKGKMEEALGIDNIPFHSADLDKDERIEFEDSFKSKKYKLMIATSTLAYGVNLPARRVIILDINRGLNPVHPYDIKQMGGRAGRPGIDPCGDVHWIVGDKSAKKAQYIIDNMPNAVSQMNDLDVFSFHIVAEIAEGAIKDFAGIKDFYERCLACHQGAKVDDAWLLRLVDKLIEFKAIEYYADYGEQKLLRVTQLGRIASWLYFSPFDIFMWYDNLSKLVQSTRKDDAAFAWAWSSIRSNSMSYVPKDCKEYAEKFCRAVNNGSNLGNIKGCEVAGLGLWLQMQGKAEDIPAGAKALTRNLMYDVDRHLQALILIDKMYGNFNKQDGLKMLATRIKYGVNWDCAKLCMLPGIGKVRAEKLIKAGIKSQDDLIEQKEVGVDLLGVLIYKKAVSPIEPDEKEDEEDGEQK